VKQSIHYIIIIILGFILYGNSIKHEFVIDDTRIIVENKDVTNCNIINLLSHGTYYGVNGINSGAYRPLTMITFSVLCKIGNGSPMPFHLSNVLLNIFVTILLYHLLILLFEKYTSDSLLYLILSCVFMSMPIHTEVVANAKSLDEILTLLFGILSTIYTLKYIKSFDNKHLYLIMINIFLSILSKETGIIFMFTNITLMYFNKIKYLKISILLIVGILYFIMRESFLDNPPNLPLLAENNSLILIKNGVNLFATKVYILGLYFSKCIYNQYFSWDYNFVINEKKLTDLSVILSIILLLVSLIVFIKNIKNEFLYSFGFLWFWLPLALTSNFIFLIPCTFGERFVFISSFGIIIIICNLILKLKIHKYISFSILTIIVFIYSFQAYSRSKAWKTNETIVVSELSYTKSRRVLLSQAIRIYHKLDDLKKNKYIKETEIQSKRDSVILLCKKVIQIYPNTNEHYPFSFIGSILIDFNQIDSAENYLIKSEKLCLKFKTFDKINDDEYSNICNKLGYIYGKRYNIDKALYYYNNAVKHNKNNFQATGNIAAIYYAKNDFINAKIWFTKMNTIDPGNEKALKYLKLLEGK
jgi:tetratricopeptide (TPR) repeat protein